MKKIIYLTIISLFTFGCTEVVEIDLEEGETRLVVDAYFNIYTDDLSSNEGGVQLSLSAPYFDDEIPTVSNADVFITNLSDNSVVHFSESETLGFFIPDTTIDVDFDIDYELTVNYNNETYTSTTQFIPTVPIDSLEQGTSTLFSDTDKELIISYKDDITREDFYLFDLDFSLTLLSEDTFYQGQDFNFSYYYADEELESQEITVKILGVDEDYYNYFNLVSEQASSGGNPFQAVPVLIKGNIVNQTNNDNYPLGYFRISQGYSKSIIIE